MQDVEGTCAQAPRVLFRQTSGLIKYRLGQRQKNNDPIRYVLAEEVSRGFHFQMIKLFPKKPELEGIGDLDLAQGAQRDRQRGTFHLRRGEGGVPVENVKGDEETCIGVGAQNLPRSRAISSAPETLRGVFP